MMNNLNIETKRIAKMIFGLSLVLFLTNCSNLDQTSITEEEVGPAQVELTDAWICEMKSFEEDDWRYEIHMQENGDYIAVSQERILKVSKDGMLNSIIMLSFPDDDYSRFRIFNNKIYRFHYDNDFQQFDPNQSIELDIYDFDFNLLSDVDLDSKGLIYDAEVENENLFGFLIYNPDENTMTLKKIHLTDGLVAENVLSTNGTSPTNLHISDSGEYYCTASSNLTNLIYFDNNLNQLWSQRFTDFVISDAKLVEGRGFYIAGRIAEFGGDEYFVALVDFNGDLVNSNVYNVNDLWIGGMQINDEKICVIQTEPESGRNMLLTYLDLDLNIESKIEIPGNIVQSNIIVNDNDSFSFVYGMAFDPSNPDFFPEPYFTRIFKFDRSYTLPSNIIEQ